MAFETNYVFCCKLHFYTVGAFPHNVNVSSGDYGYSCSLLSAGLCQLIPLFSATHRSPHYISLLQLYLTYISWKRTQKGKHLTDRYQIGVFPAETFLSSALDRRITSWESFDFGAIEGPSRLFLISLSRQVPDCTASEAPSSCMRWLGKVRPSGKFRLVGCGRS